MPSHFLPNLANIGDPDHVSVARGNHDVTQNPPLIPGNQFHWFGEPWDSEEPGFAYITLISPSFSTENIKTEPSIEWALS